MEAVWGAAQDVVVLGRLGGALQLPAAVHDRSPDRGGTGEHVRVSREVVDLADHFRQLVVGLLGVLGVEDPDEALGVVVDDHVEVEADAGGFPADREDADLLVARGDVRDALD
jgi:hypothetical protein